MSQKTSEKADGSTRNNNKEFLEQEAAYQAGIFDGDGTIVNQINNGNGYPTVSNRIAIEMQYVAGLTDSEGTIDPNVVAMDSAKFDYYMAPQFEIKMTESPVLNRLKAFAESIGVEHSHHMRDNRDKENWADCFVFTISQRESVKKYLQTLLPHLSVKQKQAEIMVNEIIPMLEAGIHSKKEGFLKVMEAVDRMQSYKGHNRGKYNLAYFEDMWEMRLSDNRLNQYTNEG